MFCLAVHIFGVCVQIICSILQLLYLIPNYISTDYAHNRMKPLPTINEWKVIKDAYLRYVDPHQVFIESAKPNNGYNFDIHEELYYMAIGIRGRGLFASRDISKGELLHNGQKTDLIFPNAMGFRQLIFNLPRDRACDVIGKR